MPINPKTGKVVKQKTIVQKVKTAQVKKHNKAFGIKPKKTSSQSKSKK
jgi:hypothetical protein